MAATLTAAAVDSALALDAALAIAAARVDAGDVDGGCRLVERICDALEDELAARRHPTAELAARLRPLLWGP